MSDEPSDSQTSQPSSGQNTQNDSDQGTILQDRAGVYIPTDDPEDDLADRFAEENPADFGSFIVSLGTNCMINLGRVEHPETHGVSKDLASADHAIAIIAMLREKTEGNLETEEEKLIDSLLKDLREAFEQEANRAKN